MPAKKNRPMVGESPVERFNVSLPPEIAERLRKAGGNNLSAGIRLAEEALRALRKKKGAAP